MHAYALNIFNRVVDIAEKVTNPNKPNNKYLKHLNMLLLLSEEPQ